ncbi:hypothetical protein Goari_004530 [Gossypium aridum]|uniref:Uncharacterized protein n=1 Tax=Gossypium aridum TaxID=34290 RepID=A0A7J8Y584_GOSAI|nr:hypothetical protein [Gossypium aridum]
MLKAKPTLESRIKTLKKDWAIIYDIITSEDVANERNTEEGSNDNGCKVGVSLDEMDVSATQSHPSNPNKANSTFSKKKKKSSEVSEPISSTSLIDAITLLGDNIRTLELSRSITSGMLIQEKVQTLYMSLGEIEGLTNDKQLMH